MWPLQGMKNKQYGFLTWARAIGTALILMCHFVGESGNDYIGMSAQFFNIGNSLFFILSGFSFGIQNKLHKPKEFYTKRLKRIYIPYELMIVSLLVVSILSGGVLSHGNTVQHWILQFLGVHGWDGIYGAWHTWFITALLLCYLLTPLISWTVSRLTQKAAVAYCISMLALPGILAFVPFIDHPIITPLFWYALFYYLGTKIDSIKRSSRIAVLLCILSMAGFALRIVARHFFDDTVFYEKFVVTYTQMLGAICILYCLMTFLSDTEAPKPVKWFANISFEVYLWHYMFIIGPLRMFDLTPYWIINCLLVLGVTLLVAFVANAVAAKIPSVKRNG